jgi:hypothetical protein
MKDVNYSMKKIISILLFTFFIINATAQKQCKIISAQAFYTINMPGTMPVDENGRQRKTKRNLSRTIFFTSNCTSAPSFEKITYNNISTRFSVEKATSIEVAGLSDNSGNKIILQSPKGFTIWKLTVIEKDNIAIPEKVNIISLIWKQKNKTNKFEIKKEVELATIPTY